MTDTAAEGTAVAQVAPGALALVKGSTAWTVADLAEKIAGPAPVVPRNEPFPAPAPAVKFTDTLRKALKALPAVFGNVMPTERRKMEMAEIKALTEEVITIDQLTTELGKRRDAICEVMRTHQDFQAEGDDLVTDETIRIADGIAKGHYLIAQPGDPFSTPVEGFSDAWQQRHVKGKVTVDPKVLLDAYEAGEISRAVYLACTKPVRAYDPMRMAEYIRRHPLDGLALLRRMTRRGAPSASLYPPKK